MTRTYEELAAQARSDAAELVRVERAGSRALVRLDDPERMNALSAAMTAQVHDRLAELVRDPGVRTIVLTGSDPAFSAGGDLGLMRDGVPGLLAGEDGATAVWRWIRRELGGVAALIARSDKAFVAAVNGPVAGAALAWALGCDLILLSERAVLVPGFGRVGLMPEAGASWQLTRRLGYQRAFELLLSGRTLGAAEAHELGLGNAVVAHDELLAAAGEWAERIDRRPPHAVEMLKPLLRGAADMTWEQAILAEELAQPSCFTTAAHRAGVEDLLARSPGGDT